jgi:hypothetical protein
MLEREGLTHEHGGKVSFSSISLRHCGQKLAAESVSKSARFREYECDLMHLHSPTAEAVVSMAGQNVRSQRWPWPGANEPTLTNPQGCALVVVSVGWEQKISALDFFQTMIDSIIFGILRRTRCKTTTSAPSIGSVRPTHQIHPDLICKPILLTNSGAPQALVASHTSVEGLIAC